MRFLKVIKTFSNIYEALSNDKSELDNYYEKLNTILSENLFPGLFKEEENVSRRNKININYYKELSDLNNLNDLDSDKIHFLEGKDILKYNSKSKKRFFRYVGLIIFSNGDIVSVLPKCMPDEVLHKKNERDLY